VVDLDRVRRVERLVLEAGDRAEELALALWRRVVEALPPLLGPAADLRPILRLRHERFLPCGEASGRGTNPFGGFPLLAFRGGSLMPIKQTASDGGVHLSEDAHYCAHTRRRRRPAQAEAALRPVHRP